MSLKQFTINFQELGKEKTLRNDVDYTAFQYDFLIENYYTFSDLFDFSKNKTVDISNFEDDFFYSEIGDISKDGDVEPVRLNFNERDKQEENYFKKIEEGDIIKVNMGEILLSKVRPNLKKYVLIDEDNKKIYFSSAFIHLVPKKINKILYYSFRTIFYKNLIAISRQGKGYPTIKEDDFLYLKFDKEVIDKFIKKEAQILAQIEQIEKKIKQLKVIIKEPQGLIDKIFAREFGFDLEEFEKLRKKDFFEVELSSLSKSKDIRSTTKFHNPIFDFLSLPQFKKHRFKDFINVEKTTLGRQIKPEYFEEESEFNYVNVNSLKSFVFNDLLVTPIKDKFFEKNKHLQVEQKDILLVASGEGSIGKSAIFNEESKCITSQFVMKINLLDKSFVQYFHFYLQSSFFQLIVEKYKKGMGNMTNIFASQLVDFPVLFSNKQQKIVDEIKTELDEQNKILGEINKQRAKIDEIIEKTVNS